MKLKISNHFWQVIGVGGLAGMRTASAPAIISQILSRHPSKKLVGSPLAFMQSEKVALVLVVFAAAEFVGDKLPGTPNRIKPSALAGRCLSGALAGASIYKASGNNTFIGALLGSAAAFGSAFGSFYLRKSIVSKLTIFDPIVGAIEDALVVVAGVGLVATA